MKKAFYNKEDYVGLFANCIVTNGKARSLISDLGKKENHVIPIELGLILSEKKVIKVSDFFSKIKSDTIATRFLQYLEKSNLILIAPKAFFKYFSELPDEYLNPHIITNAVIDIAGEYKYAYKFIEYFREKMLSTVQVRIFDNSLTQKKLLRLISAVEASEICSLQLYIPNMQAFNPDFYIKLDAFSKLDLMVVYNASEKLPVNKIRYALHFTKEKLDSSKHCGKISLAAMAPNIQHYAESLAFNTCLNNKISIDVNGDIKNCPSMSKSYGNILNADIFRIVAKRDFQKLWEIKKDDILKCKDCEFRYVCTDCRAYIDNPQNIFSAPLKCGYNPYTGNWSPWSDSPLKKEAISFYNLKNDQLA
ncbi:MAG: grasp-with-spasm system SPASM domain peptide maturase [Ferruginibacter sp.]